MPDKWTASPACILAFDVGGSHATAGLCDSDTLRVLGQASAPLRSDAQASEIIDVLYRLGCAVAGSPEKVAGAAFAVPGPFDFAAGVSSMLHKLRSLHGLDLRRALAERFGLDPGRIFFLHDAAAFLMGEVAVGSAHGATRAAGIVLGTGIGSAFARDGRWVTEGDGVPAGGEIWNLPYGAGTVEDLLSTRALKREYALQAGREGDVITIAQRAETDAIARRVFENFGTHLGTVVRGILAPFAPEVIVLGGGISRSAHLFLPFAQKQLNGSGLRLVTSSLLDEASLVGAAACWRDDSATSSGGYLQQQGDAESRNDAH